MVKGAPKNIEELKQIYNNQYSWRDRMVAIEQLKKYDCQQSRDILTRLAIHDAVFKVKEAAFRAAQGMGINKNGKPLYLGKKHKGNLVKDINKKLTHVRDNLSDEFLFDEFKVEFKKLYPIAYDIYEGDKDKHFDKWLLNVISSLPKKK